MAQIPAAGLSEALRIAIASRDFSSLSNLITKTAQGILGNSLAEKLHDNPTQTRTKTAWTSASIANMTIDATGNVDLNPAAASTTEGPLKSLGLLLLSIISEIAAIDPTLADISQGALVRLFESAGYPLSSPALQAEFIALTVQNLGNRPTSLRVVPNEVRASSGCGSGGGCSSGAKSGGCCSSKSKSRPTDGKALTPSAIAADEKFSYGDEFKNFVCPNPFLYGEVRADGELSTCCYLPFTLGNVTKDGLDGAWNSANAQAVRRSILDGSYSFCDKRKCAAMQQVTKPEKQGMLQYQVPYQLFSKEQIAASQSLKESFNGQLQLTSDGPKMVSFEDDPSCNLACPSCRTKTMMVPQEESHRLLELETSILDAIGPQLEEVWFAGAGDPFVSRSYRKLYKEYDFERFPNLKFRFDTNGVPLTPKTWNELLSKIKHKAGLMCVSVDAATKATYDITRVGGNFDLLMKNLEFISQSPERKGGMKMLLRMIVQRKNFREMKMFIELGKRLKVDTVVFSCMQNWGHLDQATYENEAVHLPKNPLHAELREILKDPIFDDPIVNPGNLADMYFELRESKASPALAATVSKTSTPAKSENKKSQVRAVAFYLPQFHPIPENDKFWGTGFTEWTNVAKATPLFEGQYQPHLPTDLGYYDLRVAEVREQQAELAKKAGIEAFCYWHYWFGGKRVLERPFNEVLQSKKPDFGFCLGWANASWTGIWHGAAGTTLIEQTYPGLEDYRKHFYEVLPAFRDERYFRVDGKPMFVIYAPHEMPSAREFTNYWRELARKEGLGDLHFVAHMNSDPAPFGCDSAVENAPFTEIPTAQLNVKPLGEAAPRTWHYKQFVDYMTAKPTAPRQHPLVFPNWDNSPRSGARGIVLHESSPELYAQHLTDAVSKAKLFSNPQEQIVFIKAWNEWAEGNYLEPDKKFGHAYIEATANVLMGATIAAAKPVVARQVVPMVAPKITSQLTAAIERIVDDAQRMADQGDLVGAIATMTPHISSASVIPGINLRLAQWNLALGKTDDAVQAALSELLVRPDNSLALEMLLRNKEQFIRTLSKAPANTVALVNTIIGAYSQQRN